MVKFWKNLSEFSLFLLGKTHFNINIYISKDHDIHPIIIPQAQGRELNSNNRDIISSPNNDMKYVQFNIKSNSNIKHPGRDACRVKFTAKLYTPSPPSIQQKCVGISSREAKTRKTTCAMWTLQLKTSGSKPKFQHRHEERKSRDMNSI